MPNPFTFLSDMVGRMRGNGQNGQPEDGMSYPPQTGGYQPDDGQQQPRPEHHLSTQLQFSDAELKALSLKIEDDYRESLDHMQEVNAKRAMERADRRRKVGMDGGEMGGSNFRPPVTPALLSSKHAREVDALGTGASVTAVPRGPTDANVSDRVALAMNWQLQENMQAVKPLALAILRRLEHGRSYMFVPWERRFYNRTVNGKTERVLWREGPGIHVLDPDDAIVPPSAQGDDTVQTMEYFGRRYRTTPTDMLLMESEPGGPQNPNGDWYQGVTRNWEKIVRAARRQTMRDSEKDYTKIEDDRDEGVNRDYGSTASRHQIGHLTVLEWYCKWRKWVTKGEGKDEHARLDENDYLSGDRDSSGPLSDASTLGLRSNSGLQDETAVEGTEYLETGGEAADLADAGQDIGRSYPDGTFVDKTDGQRKQMIEMDLIVRKVIDMSGAESIVGVQDASEVYPDSPMKRPIISLAFLNSGQFHGQSFIEAVEEIEVEITKLINQIIDATDFTIKPPIAADPIAGQNLADSQYRAGQIIWTTRPEAMKQLSIRADFSIFAELMLFYQQLYEQLTGISQIAMGRGLDAPNAPRTLGGQRLIMGAGDVRLALDMRMLSEDLKPLLHWIWDLWRMFGNEQQFFRVAEGDAQDLFDHGELKQGFAELTDKERQGYYDFTLQFADDMQVKEGKKQEYLSFGSFLMSLPAFQKDDVAQHRYAKKFGELIGIDFSEFQDEPPPLFVPNTPESAWTKLLEGQTVHAHPGEDDQAHIEYLTKAFETMYYGPEAEKDQRALLAVPDLIGEHQQAIIVKQQQAMQQAQQGLVQAAAAVGADAGHPDPMAAIQQALQQGQAAQGAQPGMPGGAQPPQGGMPPMGS